jgi:mRNA-degrading endonuclease toxin of MazEF toxin-antitoxin module
MSSVTVAWGEIYMVDVPYLDSTRNRPALIVCDPASMLDVIIAAITSRIRDPLPPTHHVIDHQNRDWAASGLRLESVVRCDRLFTVHHSQLHRQLGTLSSATMASIDDVLKRALSLT